MSPASPLSGANAVPLTSTPRGEKRKGSDVVEEPLPDEDVEIADGGADSGDVDGATDRGEEMENGNF